MTSRKNKYDSVTFEEISTDYKLIEPVSKVFGLSNEYWLSFTMNGHYLTKQFIFYQNPLLNLTFQMIPFIG